MDALLALLAEVAGIAVIVCTRLETLPPLRISQGKVEVDLLAFLVRVGRRKAPALNTQLTPVRRVIEERFASYLDLRDIFLCHAWDDRQDAAMTLHDLLEASGVSVWFSEKDIRLGVPLLRAIDKGLANSRAGIVLVTPAFLDRIKKEGVAEKELSELLAREQLIPVVHETTYEELREVSPLLGSRSGLTTQEEPMKSIATKIAELVSI